MAVVRSGGARLSPPSASRPRPLILESTGIEACVRHDNRLLQRWKCAPNFDQPRHDVEALAAEEIPVSRNEHPRCNLTEAIEHTLHAKIGRTRRPHRSD